MARICCPICNRALREPGVIGTRLRNHEDASRAWRAYVEHYGVTYSGEGATEQEARDNAAQNALLGQLGRPELVDHVTEEAIAVRYLRSRGYEVNEPRRPGVVSKPNLHKLITDSVESANMDPDIAGQMEKYEIEAEKNMTPDEVRLARSLEL